MEPFRRFGDAESLCFEDVQIPIAHFHPLDGGGQGCQAELVHM